MLITACICFPLNEIFHILFSYSLIKLTILMNLGSMVAVIRKRKSQALFIRRWHTGPKTNTKKKHGKKLY